MTLMDTFHVYLIFLFGNILLLCLPVRTATTQDPLVVSESPSVSTTQNLSNPSQTSTEASTTLATLAPQEATWAPQEATTITKSPLPTDTSTSLSLSSTLLPEVPTSPFPSSTTLGKHQITDAEVELCKENNKRLMLIFLIIIGVLVILCVFLLLTTVVMATKLSYIRRRQPSKRLPRSNGDFLSTNSLWPAGLETLQRLANEESGNNLMMQSPGPERTTAGPGKVGEEVSRKLASEISDRQKLKEVSAKPQHSTIINIEI
ncbi:protein EVI2A [Tiliqua scincoides]|uniref:protein EVI2A n=1 Tax=Tiliqua scincoides TaxID=71010 RepID=UPI0034619EC1